MSFRRRLRRIPSCEASQIFEMKDNFIERGPGTCAQKFDVDRSALVRAEPFTDTASPLLAGAYRCMSRSRVQLECLLDEVDRGGGQYDSHSDKVVITCRCKHARICRIPGYRIDTT